MYRTDRDLAVKFLYGQAFRSVVAQRVADRADGQSLSNAPQHLATLQLAAPLATRDLTLALDSAFVGRRQARTGRSLPSYWLANLVATWPRHPAVMVQGRCRT